MWAMELLKMETNYSSYNYNSLASNSMPSSQDTELTNLNWVSGAPVPMLRPVSPKKKETASRSKHARKEEARTSSNVANSKSVSSLCDAQANHGEAASSSPSSPPQTETPDEEKTKEGKGAGHGDCNNSGGDADGAKKPNCSYTSLIGLALMASEGGSLPVSEIYTYIEEEFPYFKSAPDGWKNSVRHNLSLNPAFRKVQHSMRWQGKKGFYWEVTPERRSSVEREVERYLWQEGKITEMGVANGTAPFPSCLQASIPTMPLAPSTCDSDEPSSIPAFQFCTGTQPYYDIVSSMKRHYPDPSTVAYIPSPEPRAPPTSSVAHTATIVTSSTSPQPVRPPDTIMSTLLDPTQSPSQFAGFADPVTSTTNSALLDLFGFQLTSPRQLHCPSTHMYTQSPAQVKMHVVDSSFAHGVPCSYESHHTSSSCTSKSSIQSDHSTATPEYSTDRRSKCYNLRSINTDLDHPHMPEQQENVTSQAETATSTIGECNPASQLYMDSALLDHCMALEECFVMGGGEDGSSITAMEVEFLLPSSMPSAGTREEGETKSEDCEKKKKKQQRYKVPVVVQEITGCMALGADTSPKDKGDEMEERQDMLSCVSSDSEQTMRETLLAGVWAHTTCTVVDGLFSMPSSAHEISNTITV